MRFHYIASQSNGKIIEGDFEASGTAEVLEYLANQGLRPVSLKIIKGVEESSRGLFVGQTITITDKVFLTKYLSLMLKVGTDLFKAIDILIFDIDKPAVKALLTEIRDALKKGQPFYSTFIKYPKYFSPVFINLIKAGETSGNLERVFEELSVSLEKEQSLRRTIKAALAYPIILLVMSFLILFLLVSFALPKIAGVFLTSNIEPPLFSKIVLSTGLLIGNYVWIFLIFLIVLIVSGWYLFFKTLTGKKIFNHFIAKIPVIKNVLKQLAFQRFASTLSSLLKAGLPILDALEITASAVGSEELKNSLMRISREGIAKGLTIGEAFRRETVFPRVIVNLMAISEKAGHIEDILNTLAGFYEAEAETSVKTMVTFLEPALLLVMGLVIGTIALAIIIPIYQLTAQF
ncbi:MAG: type II secretion system F family protein [Patescibacteria group bacterium]